MRATTLPEWVSTMASVASSLFSTSKVWAGPATASARSNMGMIQIRGELIALIVNVVIQDCTIEYSEAKAAIELIVAEAQKRGKAAVVAVADSQGERIAFVRMDGAALTSITIA